MFSFLKSFLFSLDPERAHDIALKSLNMAYRLKLGVFFAQSALATPRTVMGLPFPNPIGLSAGFDKNADYVDALGLLGFGFIEVGTVTPRPQEGNARPRLFRLTEQEAIINRMGFNNKGCEYVAERLAKTKYKGILGINIGKNRDTSLDNAIDDYIEGYRMLSPFASYMTINISSPNTPGLRNLQQEDYLVPLIAALKKEQKRTFETHKKNIPLVVKISPDVSLDELEMLAHVFLQQKIEGVIATNTTIDRQGVEASSYAKEAGGLSGAPLRGLSTQVVKNLKWLLKDQIPIIASGGIMDKQSAIEKQNAGASLLQIYTGLIYHGPKLIRELIAGGM